MEKLKFNPNNKKYYSEDFIKGFECGVERQYEKDKAELTTTVREKWIAQDIHNCHTDFKCSECGYIHNFTHLYGKPTADYTYCPNCGAKMEESGEEQ